MQRISAREPKREAKTDWRAYLGLEQYPRENNWGEKNTDSKSSEADDLPVENGKLVRANWENI